MPGWKYHRTLDEVHSVLFLKYNYVFSSRVMTPVPFGRGRRRVSRLLLFLSRCITRPWRLGSLCLAYHCVVG